MNKLDPGFVGAIGSALEMAATYRKPGMILWVADGEAPIHDVPARLYTGNLSEVHALFAIDSIVETFREFARDVKINTAFVEIKAALQRAGATGDFWEARTVDPAVPN